MYLMYPCLTCTLTWLIRCCHTPQGPPGTGKSRMIAGMATALASVFLDPLNSDLAAACGFRLPTLQPLRSWAPSHVAAWLASLAVTTDSDGDDSSAEQGMAGGVSAETKAQLLLAFKVSSICFYMLAWVFVLW